MLAMPNEFLQLVNSMKQEPRELSSGGSSETLDMLAFSLPEQLPGKTATLVVLGLDVYQWCNGHFGFKCWKEEGSWREQLSVCPQTQNRDPQSCLDPAVTPMDIEEALVALQLQKNMGVLFMETWQELGEYITLLTKSVAKRPFKKQCENMAFSFCVEGSWASGIRVEKDGAGLHQVWKRQIQQFNRVSPLMAAAITAKYPSPQLLLQVREFRAWLTIAATSPSPTAPAAGKGVQGLAYHKEHVGVGYCWLSRWCSCTQFRHFFTNKFS
ncbi:probable crossover junction endonuclease EME2 isoform X3 [Latimeria chalumnae]